MTEHFSFGEGAVLWCHFSFGKGAPDHEWTGELPDWNFGAIFIAPTYISKALCQGDNSKNLQNIVLVMWQKLFHPDRKRYDPAPIFKVGASQTPSSPSLGFALIYDQRSLTSAFLLIYGVAGRQEEYKDKTKI